MATRQSSIGLRLIVDKALFVRGMRESTQYLRAFRDDILLTRDAVEELDAAITASAEETKVALGTEVRGQEEVTAATRASVAATKEAAAVTKESAVVSDAATAATAKRATVLQQEAVAAEAATTSHSRLGGALSRMAGSNIIKKASMWGGLGLAGTMYEGFKTYSSMTAQMTQVMTQAGIAHNRIPALTKGALDISASTGENYQAVAKSLYMIASARSGLHDTNKELLNLVKLSAQMNVVGNVTGSSQQVLQARLLGAMVNAHLKGATNPGQIAGLMNAAIGTSDITASQMLTLVGRGIIPAAQLTGASAPSELAWASTMTKMGMNPSQIGTLLRTSTMSATGVTNQARSMLGMIGLHSGDMQQALRTGGIGKMVGLLMQHAQKFNPTQDFPQYNGSGYGPQSAIQKFLQSGMSLAGMTSFQTLSKWKAGTLSSTQKRDLMVQLLASAFGGARQGLPIEDMVANYGMYQSNLANIQKNGSYARFRTDYNRAQNTPQWEISRMRTSFDRLFYSIGKTSSPAITGMARDVSKIANWLSGHSAILKSIGIGMGSIALLSTAVIGYEKVAKPFMGFMRKGFSFLKDPLGTLRGKGATNIAQDAARMQLDAAELQLRVAEINERIATEGAFGPRSAFPGGAAGAEGVAAAEAGASTSRLGALTGRFSGVGRNLLGGAMYATMAAMMLPQLEQMIPGMKNWSGGSKALMGVGNDMATGAAGLALFGPEGAAAGALAGGIYGLFKSGEARAALANGINNLLTPLGLGQSHADVVQRNKNLKINHQLTHTNLKGIPKNIGNLGHSSTSAWTAALERAAKSSSDPSATLKQIHDALLQINDNVQKGHTIHVSASTIHKAAQKGAHLHSGSNVGKRTTGA